MAVYTAALTKVLLDQDTRRIRVRSCEDLKSLSLSNLANVRKNIEAGSTASSNGTMTSETKSTSNHNGAAICAARGSAYVKNAQDFCPGLRVIQTDPHDSGIPDGLRNLRSGNCHAVMSDEALGALTVSSESINCVSELSNEVLSDSMLFPQHLWVVGFSVGSGFEDLEASVSYLFLRYREEGELDRLYRKWIFKDHSGTNTVSITGNSNSNSNSGAAANCNRDGKQSHLDGSVSSENDHVATLDNVGGVFLVYLAIVASSVGLFAYETWIECRELSSLRKTQRGNSKGSLVLEET